MGVDGQKVFMCRALGMPHLGEPASILLQVQGLTHVGLSPMWGSKIPVLGGVPRARSIIPP